MGRYFWNGTLMSGIAKILRRRHRRRDTRKWKMDDGYSHMGKKWWRNRWIRDGWVEHTV